MPRDAPYDREPPSTTSTNMTGQRSSGNQPACCWAANPTKASTSGSATTAPRDEDQHDDAGERERSEIAVQLDEAALLLLVIDDVERIEDRLDAGIRAPQRDAEAEDEREASAFHHCCRRCARPDR